MVIVAVHGGLCHGRLSGNQLEALGGANPNEMGWWRWNEGREKGCQKGLFALVVVEFAIVFDVAICVVFAILEQWWGTGERREGVKVLIPCRLYG